MTSGWGERRERVLDRLVDSVRQRLGFGAGGSVWKRGEKEAERFLRRRGCRLLGRNVRTRIGEIDLLFEDPDRRTIIVVEVKARVTGIDGAGTDARLPERSITRDKAKKLATLAASVCRMDRFRDRPVRIDIVAVEFAPKGRTVVRHYRSAIDAGGNRR